MRQVNVRLGGQIAQSGPTTGQTSDTLSIKSKATIVGVVHYDGQIDIEGTVQGEVRCASVNVARYGTVTGTIVADNVIVAGGVSGAIYANKLVLKTDCDVEGEIYHRELSLEAGSYFDGKSRPHKEPLELATAAAEPLPLRLATA